MKPKIHLIQETKFHPETVDFYMSFATLTPTPKEADIWITQLFPVETNRDIVIGTNTTGLDHIKAPNAKIISLNDCRDELDVSATAELTWGLLLALIRRIPQAFEYVKKGGWGKQPRFIGNELKGKTLGILGFGRIGKMVAEYADAFKMNVLFFDKGDDWEQALPSLDILSVHVPLNEETEGMIRLKHFEQMKDTALFINTSRGRVVFGDDLLVALRKEHIAGAAVDVLPNEELGLINRSYIHTDNLIITPHIGGSTHESTKQTEMLIAKKIREAYG